MGVLDDAIRQHIELKRRHGASEQELQRKEEEALGPARREAAVASADGEEPAEDGGPDASGPAETPFSEQETRIFSAADAPGPAVLDEPDEGALDEPVAEPAPVDDWLEPDPDPPIGPEDGDDADGDPAGPEPADAGPEPADDPEDVLEETPEFLQETPEHDRLWFEQKPPRDFDFDDK